MSAPTDKTLELEAIPPHEPVRPRITDRIRQRAPWGIPLAVGAWILSFERLSASVTASGYVNDWWEAAVWAGIVDYSIWVGYVGLRRDPRSVRSWVLLCAGSAATIWFQADWSNPASWVPPVGLLLSLWVLERPARTTVRHSAPSAPPPPPATPRQEPPAAAEEPAPDGQPRALDAPPSAPRAPAAAPVTVAARIERIYLEREAHGGAEINAAELARELGLHPGTTRNYLSRIRRAHQGAPEMNGAAPERSTP